MSIDLVRLGRWMDQQGLGAGQIRNVTALGGGTQNVVLRFDRGGQMYVLRHPPVHKRDGSDETIRREARVLGALRLTRVPHPRLIAACEDESLLGSAFYLMESVDGFNPTLNLPLIYRRSRGWVRDLGFAAVEAAALIGAVDYEAIGLGDLGRPEGFLERQVPRWQRQLESYAAFQGYSVQGLPCVEEIAHWLRGNRPEDAPPGLVHGDYHLANVLCAATEPALVAVVDWELATIGDPLLDLGWLLVTWPDLRSTESLCALPSRDEVIQRYGTQSDRDLTHIVWYEVLAAFKLAILLEGSYARSCAGLAPKATGLRLHATAMALLARACSLTTT
jgi:aminoglycoside phosphotransferase (APT) family kinase protein